MSENKVSIQDVMSCIDNNKPDPGIKVSWEYPGYVHVNYPKVDQPNFYLAFGKHTSESTGYSWNDEFGVACGEIEDLDDPDNVALIFWGQVIKELQVA